MIIFPRLSQIKLTTKTTINQTQTFKEKYGQVMKHKSLTTRVMYTKKDLVYLVSGIYVVPLKLELVQNQTGRKM